jgi:hypothetical protein
MPFDGATYVTPSVIPAQPNFWQRVGQFARTGRWAPAKPEPARAFYAPLEVSTDNLTVQTLKIGRALIEDRKDWVQRRYETRDGRRCAVGALRGAARLLNVRGQQSAATSYLLAVANGRGFNDIESMNDNSSHKQVLSAFDDAIARASLQPRL